VARETVRVGVIGCGTIAYWAHLRSLRALPGATLIAAADPDPAARARAAQLAGVPIHDDAAELLARHDVDAVIISAPTALHADLTIAAALAGKHVYVEKPVAMDAKNARRAADAVARAGVVGAVGFSFRHHPAHQRARALLESQQIGRVHAVQTAFCEPIAPEHMPEWKRQRATGGGALLDLASHHVDLLRWLLADEVDVVSARIVSQRTEDDTASLTLLMRSGVVVQSYASFCAGPVDVLEVIGERGALRADRHALAPTLRRPRRSGYGPRRILPRPSAPLAAAWTRRLVQPSYQPSFRRALAGFIDRVHGLPSDIATFDDGVRSLDVVLAAEESWRVKAPVQVP
jgi:predicted dehydrogenase